MQQSDSARIVRLSFWVYLPMALSGWFAIAPGDFRISAPERFFPGLAIAGIVTGLVVVLSRLASRHTTWGVALREEFTVLLVGLDSRQVLLLSLLSGFGEEILFRGVLHPRLGLIPTALLFAAFHFPYRRSLVPWTAFALGVGLVLGWLVDWSGSLWPAVVLHFMINYFNLHDLLESPSES